MLDIVRLFLVAVLTLSATVDRATVHPGETVTITMPLSSPDGAHLELLANDAYTPISGGIDRGRCVWNGCVTGPGTAVMTETIRIADRAALGPLTLTALASAADGSYVTATVQLGVLPTAALPAVVTARWERPSVAQITWAQPAGVAQTCLYREPLDQSSILIRCWVDLPSERYHVRLGDVGPLDASYRPQAGDRYVITLDGVVSRAPLRSVGYMPVVR